MDVNPGEVYVGTGALAGRRIEIVAEIDSTRRLPTGVDKTVAESAAQPSRTADDMVNVRRWTCVITAEDGGKVESVVDEHVLAAKYEREVSP